MFGKQLKDDKWFKTMNKRFVKGKLVGPYSNLFFYFTFFAKEPYKSKGCRGHYYLLYLAKSGGYLAEMISDMRATLPQDLYENFSNAVEEFNYATAGLDCDDLEWEEEKKLVASFKEFDNYTSEHSNQIERILKSI